MIYIVFSKSCQPKRFVWRWNRVGKNIFKNNNKIMGFVNEMDKNVATYWYPNEKMVVVPVHLNGRCCHSRYMGIVAY